MVKMKVLFPEPVEVDLNTLAEPLSESLAALGGIPEFDVPEEHRSLFQHEVEVDVGYIVTDGSKIIFGKQLSDINTLFDPFRNDYDTVDLYWKPEVEEPETIIRDHSYVITSIGLVQRGFRLIDEESFEMTEGKGTFVILPLKVAGKN